MRTVVLTLTVFVLGLGLVACGSDEASTDTTATQETTTDTTTTEETTTDTVDTTASGRAVFVANCGSCHTLADAGTSGTVGPSLDGSSLSADDVESQVRNGGGGMPAFEESLSDDEIAQVAAYVAGG